MLGWDREEPQMQVTVLGSINVDSILSVAALPGPGETVLAHAEARLPGGKGANQAIAAARMGAETAMVGAVGGDPEGAWMRAQLSEHGVDVTRVQSLGGAATGAATIAVDDAGENLIVVLPGANARLTAGHVPSALPGLLLAQLEIPVAAVAAALDRADGPVLLNAAPTVPDAAALFPRCDVVIVNQHELGLYAGTGRIEGKDAAAAAARKLLSRRDQTFVVTLGAGGALAVRADRDLHVPAVPVTPLDTVGAGDCFCGALAALLAEGRPLDAALAVANAAAALCTQARGAAPAMPRRAAVEALCDAPTDSSPPIKKARAHPID